MQHWEDIEQQYITPKIWTEYPLMEIGNLLAEESSSVVESVVHLSGRIASAGAGQPMVLEDESGRIVLDGSGIGCSCSPVFLDVLGRVSLGWFQFGPSVRPLPPVGRDGTETNSLPVLTTVEQICQLSLEEAARGYPVRSAGCHHQPYGIRRGCSSGFYTGHLRDPYRGTHPLCKSAIIVKLKA